MATTRKSLPAVPPKKALSQSLPAGREDKKVIPPAKKKTEKSADELAVENFTTLTTVVSSLGATIELLVQKVESMAHHIIATEEILAEIVAANGLNLARVNARIRAKIASGTDNNGNANPAVDIAAAIASPLPRR